MGFSQAPCPTSQRGFAVVVPVVSGESYCPAALSVTSSPCPALPSVTVSVSHLPLLNGAGTPRPMTQCPALKKGNLPGNIARVQPGTSLKGAAHQPGLSGVEDGGIKG